VLKFKNKFGSLRVKVHHVGFTVLISFVVKVGLYNKPKAEMHPGRKLTGPKDEEEEELVLSIKKLTFEQLLCKIKFNFRCAGTK
jgi:hypothetical protein